MREANAFHACVACMVSPFRCRMDSVVVINVAVTIIVVATLIDAIVVPVMTRSDTKPPIDLASDTHDVRAERPFGRRPGVPSRRRVEHIHDAPSRRECPAKDNIHR